MINPYEDQLPTSPVTPPHEHIEFKGAYTSRRNLKKCGICFEFYNDEEQTE